MTDDQKPGAPAPEEGTPSAAEPENQVAAEPPFSPEEPADEPVAETVPYQPTVDDNYGHYEDPYGYNPYPDSPPAPPMAAETVSAPPAPPPPSGDDKKPEDDDDNDGMLRMSFMEHLEELRRRIIYGLGGLGVAFALCLTFTKELWLIVQEPAAAAFRNLGMKDVSLVFTSPMESFTIIWVKLPLLTSIFIGSPWILFQVWRFISPGLYPKERRFAAPFVIFSAGLFILGGLFAYFVAFRFGLTFLLGIGQDVGVRPMVTITEYFDIFVNVILSIAIVFELPVLIFFLTLLRIASPRFLLANSRYAILIIVIVAAIVTPTADVFNLMLFSVPMVLLFFIGIFASYLLVLNRENKRFPWRLFVIAVGIPLLLITAGLYLAIVRYGLKFVSNWPFLIR